MNQFQKSEAKTQYCGVIQLQRVNDGKVAFSRTLRKNMTIAEAVLWSALRGKRCSGLKFRRQQIIEGFIADFFCAEKNLVVEVDGPYHDSEKQKKYDERRRNVFKSRGVKEIRFRNEEVIHNLSGVKEKILKACSLDG